MSQESFPRQNSAREKVEETIYVQKDMIGHPLGFVIDAGSSIIKLAYRSKEDYSAGKALEESDRGKLRLRNFNMNQVGQVIGFLKENCDINVNPDDDNDEEWWITGVTTQHFKKELDSTLKIKTKLFSELAAIASYLKHFGEMDIGCYEVDLEALNCVKGNAALFLNAAKIPQQMKLEKRKNDPKNSIEVDPLAGSPDCPALRLLSCDDVALWAEEHASFSGRIEYPVLLAHLGSAGPLTLVTEDGYKFVDYTYGIGKIIGGLSEELTGESDFAKFIEMAGRGELENVDLTTDDICNPDHHEDDDYKYMPKKFTIFELGKLSSNNFNGKGKYNKDDLAIGLLTALIKLACKIIFLNAKEYNVKSILFSGSMSKYKLIRRQVLKCLLMDSLMNNMRGKDLIKVQFLKNPGFICSLGVWWENVEKQREKKKN